MSATFVPPSSASAPSTASGVTVVDSKVAGGVTAVSASGAASADLTGVRALPRVLPR